MNCIDPHSGSVCPHSGCVCVDGERDPILTNGCADDKYQKHGPPRTPPHFNNRGTQKIDLSEKEGEGHDKHSTDNIVI